MVPCLDPGNHVGVVTPVIDRVAGGQRCLLLVKVPALPPAPLLGTLLPTFLIFTGAGDCPQGQTKLETSRILPNNTLPDRQAMTIQKTNALAHS